MKGKTMDGKAACHISTDAKGNEKEEGVEEKILNAK